MTTAIRTEPSVAKKLQKTLLFDESVANLIQAYADRKGATFQRVLQAAALQFFFGNYGNPDERWITAFVELEKGDGSPPVDLSTLPIRFHEREAERLSKKLALVRQKYSTDAPKSVEHQEHRKATIAGFEHAILLCEHQAGLWRTLIQAHGGDTKGIIDLYAGSGPDDYMESQLRVEESHSDDEV